MNFELGTSYKLAPAGGRILLIIKELVLDLAEILEIPFEELITKIISENKQLMKWINLNPLSEAA